VCPTGVGTTMILNDGLYKLFNEEEPTQKNLGDMLTSLHAIPRPWLEPEDVSNLVLFLASDDARYMTGSRTVIDMGFTAR
jgi:NAD(P)-dependent dehydrogenase (short-subunit alcohol dehydrogenase family)